MIKSGHGFKVISSSIDYENPFMRVYRYEVIRPNGKLKPFWTLNRYGDFSIAIPLFPDNSTILVGQYRIPVSYFSWEFPMGYTGESPLISAKQELQEETGYKAKEWEKIGNYFLAPGHNEQGVHIFVGRGLIKGKRLTGDNDEFIRIKKVKIETVGQMIRNGKIKDGATIVGYHYLEKYFNKKL